MIRDTTVVHMNKEAYDVDITRNGDWGNPFIIGKDGDRETVIEKYARYLKGNRMLMSKIHMLRGKRLGCWCKPKACHGDVLAAIVNHVDLFEMGEE